jgi:hypothetical protein
VTFRMLAPADPPTGVVLDEVSGEIVWPADLNAGTYVFEIAAQNQVGAATARVALTVSPLSVEVLPDAGQSKPFGVQDPVLTYTLSPALDTGMVVGALSRVAGEAVGAYAFQLGNLRGGANYAFSLSSEPRTFAIVPATPRGLAYGDAAYAGVFGTEDASTAPTLESDGGEAVRYAITMPEVLPDGLGIDPATGVLRWSETLAAGDYTLTIAATNSAGSATAQVDLRILPLRVTVLPDAGQLKVIGAADPVFTYTLTPSLEPSMLTGVLSREPGETAGMYAFTLGDLSAGPNYRLVLAEDAPTFMIARPEIVVTTMVSTASPALGDTLTVRVRVQSTGLVPAENIRIRITPDQPRLEVLAWRAGSGSVDEETWMWRIERLDPGEELVLEFDAVVREGVDGQPVTVGVSSTGTDASATVGGA